MLEYNSEYKLLICPLHQYAVHDADQHLRYAHSITGKEKDALLDQWKDLDLTDPKVLINPAPGGPALDFLTSPVQGHACRICNYMTDRWTTIQSHIAIDHDILRPPVSYGASPHVITASLQTFFSHPLIRWFEVNDPNLMPSLNPNADKVLGEDDQKRKGGVKDMDNSAIEGPLEPSMKVHDDKRAAERRVKKDRPRLRALQSARAAILREENAEASGLHRLPREIRDEIYLMVLPKAVTYHIVDKHAIVKPDFSFGKSYNYDRWYDDIEDEDLIEQPEGELPVQLEKRNDWEELVDDWMLGKHYADEDTTLRVVSLPESERNFLAILQVCDLLNAEATPLFYSQNQFRIHSADTTFATALQFLDLLSPTTMKCITSFGALGLQPCGKEEHGRLGTFVRDPKLDRTCRLYSNSEDAFYKQAFPQMSLKELSLGFDLGRIECRFGDLYREWSPQASWLNKFLRLPLERITLTFADLSWKMQFNGDPPPDLIEPLNHVDGQTRIRAKYDFEDNFPSNDHWEEARSGEEKRGYALYSYNDIWAEGL